MLETMRQYARERLANEKLWNIDACALVCERHFAYFLEIAEREEQFAALWEEGKAMPFEEVTSFCCNSLSASLY